MSQIPSPEITEVVDPVGHVQVIYLGPVAPHWECRMVFGDEEQIQAFVDRVDARLRFLPPHDPPPASREPNPSPFVPWAPSVAASRRSGVIVGCSVRIAPFLEHDSGHRSIRTSITEHADGHATRDLDNSKK